MTRRPTFAHLRVTRALGPPLGLALVLAGGCRRPDTLTPVDFGAAEAMESVEGGGQYAPRWPAPERALLDSGLLVHLLHEPTTPLLNLRLVFPLPADVSPAEVAVVGASLDQSVQARLAGAPVAVRIVHGPDRLELELRGDAERRDAMLEALSTALAARRVDAVLDRARRGLAKSVATATAEREATAWLAARLLDRKPLPPARPDTLAQPSAAALARTHDALVDPRRALLVIHGPEPLETLRPALEGLGSAWRSARPLAALFSTPSERATERLRPPPPPADGREGRLRPGELPPLEVVEAPGAGKEMVLVLGRLLPTPDAESRALARLAHRIIEQELDARLVMSGPVALFVVAVPLPRDRPEKKLREVLDTLEELAATRHRRGRLEATAAGWLGARVVRASLGNEDWTALWLEAFDLAGRDAELTVALAREAQLLLAVDPERLLEFQQQWLRPAGGAPGWRWALAGGDADLAGRLRASVDAPAR